MNRDGGKIAFVSCVNDEEMYAECALYLRHLELPAGFSAELVPVRGAPSMTAGYEAGRRATEARYKIYLHQDLLLTDKKLIVRIVEIFQAHPDVGLIGLAGCLRMPGNGVWWDGEGKYGAVYEMQDPESLIRLEFSPVPGDVVSVEAVDGIFMATQQDVPWREDLFKGWHFYDISASMEYRRRGMRVLVPHFASPPCIHESGRKKLDDSWEEARQIFLAEYAAELNDGRD